MDRRWIPVRRHWRLNERHYGNLTGHEKTKTLTEVGTEQFLAWRRGYMTPPPPIADDNPDNPDQDPRYRHIPEELIPRSQCLHDVYTRLLPYWYDRIIPDLQTGSIVLVVAHGNSLRALCKHLDKISDDSIAALDIPTGTPLVYELDRNGHPISTKATLDRRLSSSEGPAELPDTRGRPPRDLGLYGA